MPSHTSAAATAARKLGKGILPVFLLALVIAPANAAPGKVRYACRTGQDLSVERSEAMAHVSLGGRTYDLRRERSSLGQKYISSDAALIIDGPTAVFVTDELIDLGTCVRPIPLASSR